MMGTRLSLEQFDTAPGPSSGLDLDGFELPGMDDPMIRPAPVEDRPDTAEIEALREELAAGSARLIALIDSLEAERARHAGIAAETAARRVAAIGAELMRAVVREGFAHEIATAVADLARRAPASAAILHVADADHETLASLVAAARPEGEITVITDPALEPGSARMAWPEGGAEFDRRELEDRIAPMIARHLSDLDKRSEK